MRQRIRQGRSRKTGGDSKDRWMITYADLITLLLIFFVMMYAMSRLDTEKYKSVTESLQATFNTGTGTSLLDGGSSLLDGSTANTGTKQPDSPQPVPSAPQSSPSPSANGQADGSGQEMTERELAFRKQEQQLATLMQRIEQYIQDNDLGNQIFVSDQPQGIAITLSDEFLFDTGKAELKTGSSKILAKLASMFGQIEAKVSIEGHTDNQPIVHASRYKDNWELSGARALSILRYFLDNAHLNANSFQYAGYGDTRPAADNSTEAGRKQNRRVEITVLRQLQKQ